MSEPKDTPEPKRKRILSEFLTEGEIADLREDALRTSEYARKSFAHLRTSQMRIAYYVRRTGQRVL